MEAEENTEKQLKIINLVNREDIINDQKKNISIRDQKNKLILMRSVYYKKVREKNEIIISKDFSIKFLKNIHENKCHILRYGSKTALFAFLWKISFLYPQNRKKPVYLIVQKLSTTKILLKKRLAYLTSLLYYYPKNTT